MSSEKMLAKLFQFAMLQARPVVNAIRKMQAALAAGTPTEIRMGSTMEPTMMMEPRPLRVVNRTAVATTMIRVTTSGRSPPSSALFLMMFSVTPVLPISAPSAFLPNIGTPAMMQMTTAIKGSASRVGIFLVIINAATTRNATTIRMPCNIVLLLFLRGQAPFILTVNHGKFHFQASVLHSRL